MTDENEKKEWRFHSPGKNEEVYDPVLKGTLCAFKNYELITDDPKLAQALQKRGYEEWVVFNEDDTITLDTGKLMRLGDLPAAIREEWVGKPKRAAQDLLGKIKSLTPFSTEEDPADSNPETDPADEEIKENQCPICKRQFDSPSGLNGHFAHCKTDNDKEAE